MKILYMRFPMSLKLFDHSCLLLNTTKVISIWHSLVTRTMYSVCVCSWNQIEVGGKCFVNNLGGLPPLWTVLKASIRAQRIQTLLFVQNSISRLSKGRVLWWHKIIHSVRGSIRYTTFSNLSLGFMQPVSVFHSSLFVTSSCLIYSWFLLHLQLLRLYNV